MRVTTVFKPAGVPVFPPHADPNGDCVLRRLLVEAPWRADVRWPEGFEGGVAHRLDNDTSGALLVADDIDSLDVVRGWFRDGALTKRYLLLSGHAVPWTTNRCDRPIGHDPRRKGRMVVQRGASTPHRGRWYDAHTVFVARGGPLWQAEITTGVTHQIRVHAAFVGIPLAGDRRYGGGSPPAGLPEGVSFALHHDQTAGPDGFVSAPVPRPAWATTGGGGAASGGREAGPASA